MTEAIIFSGEMKGKEGFRAPEFQLLVFRPTTKNRSLERLPERG